MHPVYFVRHGESEWNVADRICGQTDVALTDPVSYTHLTLPTICSV